MSLQSASPDRESIFAHETHALMPMREPLPSVREDHASRDGRAHDGAVGFVRVQHRAMTGQAIAYVVDDDRSIRESLDSLLRSVGYQVFTFASAEDFLAFDRPRRASCLLLDIRMPGPNGLQLQEHLVGHGDQIPIIFLTGHGDVPLSVRAMKAGARDFFLKPFHEETLLEAARVAIERDRSARLASDEAARAEALFKTLTRREAEVIALVAQGLSSKDIASHLSLAEITIKVNRANAMRKLECRSMIDLANLTRKHEPASGKIRTA